MPVEIRHAVAEDMPRAQEFYVERQYGGGIGPEDAVLLAERDGELVGIVRLVPEQGVTVLRGMQVHPSVQRQGLGNRLLAAVAHLLRNDDCFCIPYAHLVDFYGGIGFVPIAQANAPPFLRSRLEGYQRRGDGQEYLLMYRKGHPDQRSAPSTQS
ncbi:MAG: GNAT family N-acetyltransferase [Chthoniobacterales bacterium]|nr:GNAT family N-acetyltransferase [Chthoniobacterales bacterium]